MKLCYKQSIHAICFTLLAAACVLQMRGLDFFKPIPGSAGTVQSKKADNDSKAVPDSTMASKA